MFERNLIPLDGSPIAEAALAYAELLPSQRVRLLQVEPATGGLPSRRAPDDQAPESDGEGRAYLERAGARLRRQGRAVEPVVTAGDPAECIIDSASDTDLIVMTTRDRGASTIACIPHHQVVLARIRTTKLRQRRALLAPERRTA